MQLPVARQATLHFVDLGSTYASGFGRSLVAACPLLARNGEDFLLCTPDHIFDARLVQEIRTTARRKDLDAVALVEENARSLTGALPPTAVHVRFEELPAGPWPAFGITQIGTQLGGQQHGRTGIEAGLYRCSGALFTILAELSSSKDYTTVAEAMQTMASGGRLGAMMAAGRQWLALETLDQLQSTIRSTVGADGRARFPWQLRTVHTESLAATQVDSLAKAGARIEEIGGDPLLARRLVLPLAGDPDAATIAPTPSQTQLDFVLMPSSGGTASAVGSLNTPLLETSSPSQASSHGVVDALTVKAAVGVIGADFSALSIELTPPLGSTSSSIPAYLIELPPASPNDPLQSLLALPAQHVALEGPVSSLCHQPLPLLPSAIDRVTLTPAEDKTVSLTVHKTVPTVGWALLALALLACYSGAPVTTAQRIWLPARGSAVFLHSAWRGTASSAVCALAAWAYPISREHLHTALCLRLRRPTVRLLALSGAAFFVNFGAFNMALEYTSISHAALFESCSSIYLVIGQLLAAALGRAGCVPISQMAGVAIGGLGAFLTMRDASTAGVIGTPVSMAGDVFALCSGLGAAIYLSAAEAIRADLDPLAFFSLVMAQFAVLCFAASALLDDDPPSVVHPFDTERGILGWLNPVPARLPVQLWLALVVDLAGNLGFIVVMKFVPALTVAAAMLLGPLVATLEGILVGVDQIPGPWTIGGGMLITAGSGLISFATSESSTTVEIHPTGD